MAEDRPGDQPNSDSVLDISLDDLGEDAPGAPPSPWAPPGSAAPSQAGEPPVDSDLPLAGGSPPPSTPLPAVHDAGSVLDISLDDLRDVPARPPTPAMPLAGQHFPAVDMGGGYAPIAKKVGIAEAILGATMLQMLIAGAVGGFVSWMLIEPFVNEHQRAPWPGTETPAHQALAILALMAGFGAALGGCIGAALGSVEGLLAMVWQKALRGLGIGLGIGALGGALGGFVGQLAYGLMHAGGSHTGIVAQVLARAFAWGLVGAFVGVAQGVVTMAPRKILNGVIGGAVGGFIGGFLFDPIGQVLGGGAVSRVVAMTVTGGCTGAAIGLVEMLRKEAWLRIVEGPLAGKQFILYRPVTLIGSAPGMDIALVKDPNVSPKHCSIELTGTTYVLRDLGSGAGTGLNGRPVTQQALRSGDTIQVGYTGLLYEDRAVRPGAS